MTDSSASAATVSGMTAQLRDEHQVLMAAYGRVQRRCSERLMAQQAQIERLTADLMRTRARAIVRETQLDWALEERRSMEAQIPGLPRRRVLASHVEQLLGRVQSLMRELKQWRAGMAPGAAHAAAPSARRADAVGAPSVLCLEPGEDGRLMARRIAPSGEAGPATGGAGDSDALLEASLVAADLVICQTGCVNHDAYWRVQDHCRRTGKACVLVDPPQALHWMTPLHDDVHRP